MTASRPSFMHLSPADTVGIALRPLAARPAQTLRAQESFKRKRPPGSGAAFSLTVFNAPGG